MKRTMLGMALATVALSFATAANAQDKVVKIGVIEPLSGVVAAPGTYVTDGIKVAADEINAKGGINGAKIQLVIEDNKSNPTESANAAEKLIVRDKVPVIIGAWGSTYTLAVMPKLMEYKVPLLVETSSADKITTEGNPYVFRISPTNGMEAQSFQRLAGPLGIKKADFLVGNNDWGLGAAAAFGDMLKKKGLGVGKTLTMDGAAQDMTSQLATIKGTDSDTLFITTGVEQLALVLKQAQSLGLKRRIITTGGTIPDQLITDAGSAADGTYHDVMFTPWFPDMSANPSAARAFVAEWKRRGLPAEGMLEAARGYDAIFVVAQAIKNAGAQPSAEAIRKALWDVKLKGLTGDLHFDKVGPKGKESGQSPSLTEVIQIKDGKIVQVKG